MANQHFPKSEESLLNSAISASYAGRSAIDKLVNLTPARAFEPTSSKDHKGKSKTILAIDKQAENNCAMFLTEVIGEENILVLGEETLWQHPRMDLSDEKRVVAILDMIDGSDLLERGLGNWCSAMVFLDPQGPRILCSVVHDARGRMYYAKPGGAFVIPHEGAEHQRIPPPSSVPPHQAAICFYGQKATNLADIPRSFTKWTLDMSGKKNATLRLYNLAGTPMMAKLANSENIHVVFDRNGQFPHDAIPGAYIALQAGACLVGDDGQRLSESTLAQLLLKPSGSKLKYVLAVNKSLATAVAKSLWPQGSTSSGVEASQIDS